MKSVKTALLALAAAAALCFPAFAGTSQVTVERKAPNGTEDGYLLLTIDEANVEKLFDYPNSNLIPGDTAEGELKFVLKPGITPVKARITATDCGDAEMYAAMSLKITRRGETLYNGLLKNLTETGLGSFINSGTTEASETLKMELAFTKGKSLNGLQGKSLAFSMKIVADMTDYYVIKPANYVSGEAVEVYQSLYNEKFYYTASGSPVLEGQFNGKGTIVDYAPDYVVDPGKDGRIGTADDYYIDYADGLNVYVGADNVFGTADDRKDLENGSSVERGTHANASDDFGGGKAAQYQKDQRYVNGPDGIPGTADDIKIAKGNDGSYDTVDDHFTDTDGLTVYAGSDLFWLTADDRKDIENGTNVERGAHTKRVDDFGGGKEKGFQNDRHYTNGKDLISGSADDFSVDKGTDGTFGTVDDFYTDTDGLKVFMSNDLAFGTAGDRKDLGNGSNIERGTHANASDDFGGGKAAGYQNDKRYTNGADTIPGTADDELINKGRDGVYGTELDFTNQNNNTNNRPGKDRIWGTTDDETWHNGNDGLPGNLDDRLLGYPNQERTSGGSYSGGGGFASGVTGEGGMASSPVAFAKAVDGSWSFDGKNWSFTTKKGETAKNKWVYIYSKVLDQNDWYYFDGNGVMQSGWQKTGSGKWYRLHNVNDARFGAMEKGLFFEPEDGRYYYLDPQTGVLQTGWIKINDKYYYFAETPTGLASWFWNSSLGRWAYNALNGRPAGSMYVNEVTPDGYRVDANGARIEGSQGR